MKRGLFLLATVTLSSALYAQSALTPEKAREIVGNFNPQLLERAAQDQNVSALVEELISAYLAQKPIDGLATKYELAALSRNFDNSLDLYRVTQEYQQAVCYSSMGTDVEPSARQHAEQQLRSVFSRIWAVSVQTKEGMLGEYKQLRKKFKKDTSLTPDQKNLRLQVIDQGISALNTDLKNLKTNVGEQITDLVRDTLDQAKANVRAQQTALHETSNLQIKTKHKKPVAE